MIEVATLDAIKGLVRLVLQRERECLADGAPLTSAASPELEAQLHSIPNNILRAAIQRHRLESLLNADPLVGILLPKLAVKLKALARAETMAALALASLSREMAGVFERAGISMLVIKGVPLSIQTTRSLTARGRGDLDLLVDPNHLHDAVQLLEEHGFTRKAGMFPKNLHSIWGRYSRWVGYEFSLIRYRENRVQSIDLHWALSNIRAPLPNFQDAWAHREILGIAGQEIATLSRCHAFQHACAHAAKDQWMCLRNLVDIERLSRLSNQKVLGSVKHFRVVQLSCLIAHDLVSSASLRNLSVPIQSSRRRILRKAQLAQARQWRSQGDSPWRPQDSLVIVISMLMLSVNGEDWLRTLLYYTLLPAAFSDPDTGKDRGLAGLLKSRIRRLKQRAGESQRPNPGPSA